MASNKFNYYDGNGKLNDSITDISNYQNSHSLNGALYFDIDRKTIFANPGGTGIKEFGGTVQPIMEKTYENYTCGTGNNQYLFFINLIPNSSRWTDVYSIKYKIIVNTSQKECQGEYDCYLSFSGSTLIYGVFNKFYSTNYYPIYTHYFLSYDSETKFNDKSAHPMKIGAQLASAYHAIAGGSGASAYSALPRTYTIKIYEANNCTVSFIDPIETYAGVFNSANYVASSITATSMGLQESGDATDITTIQLTYSTIKAGANGIKGYSLIMEDSTGSWQSFHTTAVSIDSTKTVNTSAFRLGSRIYYVSRSTDLAANSYLGTSQLRVHQALVDFRYSLDGITNSSSTSQLVNKKPVYIVGTLDSNGYFKLDTTKYWTQDEPTTQDGKIYIRICDAAYDWYRGDLVADGTPWHYYKGKFQVYYGTGGGGSALSNMSYNSGIKIGEYLDEDEVSHNIYIPEPIVSTQYSTGINVASYKTSSGSSQIKIPEISTMPAYASGISIAYYPNAASGNTYIHIPIQRVTSMPSSPNTNMIYIVSEMANGTTNPDEPGTGLDDYVTLSQVYEYVSNNYVSFTTLNTRLNDSSYITSTTLNNLLDDFIIQEQLDESAYITQDYLNNAGYLTSHQSLANYATKSELQTEINNLVNGAPSVLDTLGEIATALSNNQSVSTAITTQIANVKTDLNSYAKTVTLNGTTKSITAGTNDINIGTVITSHAKHKLNATNGTATSTSGTITFVESISGTTIATDGDLSVSTTRKSVTIPAAPVQSDWSISNTNDLSYIKNKPTIPAAQVQSNWNETSTSSKAYILNKPEIPAAQVQSNWNETSISSKAYIQNKPTIGDATISITKGSYTGTFTTNATANKTINLPNELPSYSSSDSGKVLSINSSGQLVWITPVSIYSGSGEPLNSLGNNGDIYIQN